MNLHQSLSQISSKFGIMFLHATKKQHKYIKWQNQCKNTMKS